MLTGLCKPGCQRIGAGLDMQHAAGHGGVHQFTLGEHHAHAVFQAKGASDHSRRHLPTAVANQHIGQLARAHQATRQGNLDREDGCVGVGRTV